MDKKFKVLNIISNSLVFLLVVASIIWIVSVTEYGENQLLASGWEMLKFFTVQSNILMGIASLISLIYILIGVYPKWVSVLKYVATGTVTLTFLTVMFYLGPALGYLAMLKDANLLMHLVTPVISIAQLFLLEPKIEKMRFVNSTVISILPMTAYGIAYLINIFVHNGYGNVKYDWYYFGTYGPGAGIGIFFLMLAFTYLIGVALYFGYQKIKLKDVPVIF